jgi:hypothetical protein
MSDVIEETDIFLMVDDLEVPCCESTLHMVDWRMPPHEAAWYAATACLNLIAVCDARRRLCRQHGGWKCIGGCTGVHDYSDIEWTPVRMR